jgi:DNA-binding CsgD family transcriptional regulator
MTRSLLPVSVIEAAYRVELGQREWLGEIARTMQAMNGSTLGALALLYDATKPDWVLPVDFGASDIPPAFVEGLFRDRRVSADDARAVVQAYRSLGVVALRDAPYPECLQDQYATLLDELRIGDVLCVNATDPTHRGCLVMVPSAKVTIPRSRAQLWRRLGAHVAAGARLRRSLAEVAKAQVAPTDHAEAVVRPDGRVDHAQGPAIANTARERLRDSIVRVERARSQKPTADEAVALWEGLVAGRWSVVEHFERDGKRYYLAHRNDPELAPDRALSAREQQVFAYAELGYSNKLIAYSLGLAISTISTLLTSARSKLGLRAKGR